MPGTPELHKAMKNAWDAAALDDVVKGYWSVGDRPAFEALNDTEAAPGTPFPYVVYEQEPAVVTDRMSGEEHLNLTVIDIPWRFRIYAKDTADYPCKTIAVALAERIFRVFGGHPSSSYTPITLDISGYGHLLTQYTTDYGARIGEKIYLWTIEYLIRLDAPVAV